MISPATCAPCARATSQCSILTRRPCSTLSNAATSPIAYTSGALAAEARRDRDAAERELETRFARRAACSDSRPRRRRRGRPRARDLPRAARAALPLGASMNVTVVPVWIRTPRRRRRASNQPPTSAPKARFENDRLRHDEADVAPGERGRSGELGADEAAADHEPARACTEVRADGVGVGERPQHVHAIGDAGPKSRCLGSAPVASTSEP